MDLICTSQPVVSFKQEGEVPRTGAVRARGGEEEVIGDTKATTGEKIGANPREGELPRPSGALPRIKRCQHGV